jgi:hypothetical protein
MVSVFVQGENEQVIHRKPDSEIIPGYGLPGIDIMADS